MCRHRFVIVVRLAAGARDRELYTAEAKFANAKEESDFYMASLQQLTLFKSRSERALLDTQSRAESAAREALEARARYEKVRLFIPLHLPPCLYLRTLPRQPPRVHRRCLCLCAARLRRLVAALFHASHVVAVCPLV